MFINKKQFIESLERIKSIVDDIYDVHNALKKLDPDFGGFYISRVETELLDLLKICANDEGDWISYYIYELEWGKKYKKGTVTSKNGRNIPLKTMSDLYEIIKNKI